MEKPNRQHIIVKQTSADRETPWTQSFLDDFAFEGPVTKKIKQIGNAAHPLVSLNIAKTIYYGLLQ